MKKILIIVAAILLYGVAQAATYTDTYIYNAVFDSLNKSIVLRPVTGIAPISERGTTKLTTNAILNMLFDQTNKALRIGVLGGITPGGDTVLFAWYSDTANYARMANAIKIQGRNISSAIPSIGQVLGWDGTQWVPMAGGGKDTVSFAWRSSYADSANSAYSVNYRGRYTQIMSIPWNSSYVAENMIVSWDWDNDGWDDLDSMSGLYTLIPPGGYGAAWGQYQVPNFLPKDTLRHLFGGCRDSIFGFRYRFHFASVGYNGSISWVVLFQNGDGNRDTLFSYFHTVFSPSNPGVDSVATVWLGINDLKDSMMVIDPSNCRLFFRMEMTMGGETMNFGQLQSHTIINWHWREH